MDLLEQVEKLEHTADQFGFRWENTDQIMAQIQSECMEINVHLHQPAEQLDRAELQEEIGDLLHAVFSLCVFCQFNPKNTLEKTLEKFGRRLEAVKKIASERGLNNLEGHSFDELMQIWSQAKQQVDKNHD